MSAERTSAEVVKDLRGFIDWYGCDPGVPMSAVDVAAEGAVLIEHLDGEIKRLADFIIDSVPGEPSESGGAVDCAIRLIERLTGENERLAAIKKSDDGAYEHVVGMWHAADSDASILADQLKQIEAALPACPTCTNVPGHQLHPNPCLDCVDGKVSPAQLAALWQAVHDVDYVHPAFLPAPNGVKEAWVAGAQSVYRHLRAVRPT